MPPVPTSDPAISSGRAPIFGTSCAPTPDASKMAATIGRYAMPDLMAL